ncbi:MAG TPA: dynamin family protein [Metabacillus sp.]|nr:dynamin family protein [Metabacillus sp.]
MTTVVKSKQLMQTIINLHERMHEQDQENANKLVEMAHKLNQQKLYIAFAGHFSAGKSSMINKLLDEQILPTSPIPTSANLVLLEKGIDQVTLFSAAKESIELSGDYSIEQVKEYCKQGDDIERIRIKKPYQNLTEGVVIMDSPGIDSTDAAHKLSTESMLHLADVIFYVTDYNHVQSEENLSFIREMKDRNKLIFLIVNQIDKHEEKEIRFDDFKQNIEGSFAEVGLHPQDVFFTTLRNDKHPYNELEKVKELINVVIHEKNRFLDQNLSLAITQVVEQHLEKYKEQIDLTDQNESEIRKQLEEYTNSMNGYLASIKQEEEKLDQLRIDTEEKVSAILKSANLIPYETREKAAAYIESADPSFKIGFLFSKTKTEQEREKRKNELYDSLIKNTETQIAWHFISLLKEFIQTYEIHDPKLIQEAQSFSIKVSQQLVSDAIKAGASYNNQYVLTYSSDVSELIKKHSKLQVMSLLKKMMDVINSELQDQMAEIKEKIKYDNEMIGKCQDDLRKFEKFWQYNNILREISKGISTIELDEEKWLTEHQLYKISTKSIQIQEKRVDEEESIDGPDQPANSRYHNRDVFIKSAEQVVKRLENILGFKQFTDSLEGKINNFNNRSFTVALFGAFSAGKSSFANALIGERLLPSSPNPTTATINKIAPPTSEKAHGLVEVKLKSKELLMKEIIDNIPSLNNKGITIENVTECLQNYQGQHKNETEQIVKYQKAMMDYESLTNEGLIVQADNHSFKDFVAKEEKACLVEEVIVYFDCPITRAGITLVDTPGADSLHKRHTDVAFQYIKKADAVLYVTYYNHPFSKGDREFLRQLGRVKDSFTLDKMFFIINAVDLAKNEEEVNLVKSYIREQFLKHEIRNVRLFGVSSLNILSNKVEEEKDYLDFQHQFNIFIKEELTNTTLLSIKEDLKRCTERIKSLIHAAEMSVLEKEKIRETLLKEQISVNDELANLTPDHIVASVSQEIEELIFYVKQRLFFRFNDFFKESFHPSIFHQNSDIQQALQTCLEELVRTVEFELIQELQATSLRIEKVIQKTLESEFSRIVQLIKKKSQSVTFASIDFSDIQTPTISVEFSENIISTFHPALKLFKNTKSFFERNEKKVMAEDLSKRFDGPTSVILNEYVKEFSNYYKDAIESAHNILLQEVKKQTEEGFAALLDIRNEDTGHLKSELENITEVVKLLEENNHPNH